MITSPSACIGSAVNVGRPTSLHINLDVRLDPNNTARTVAMISVPAAILLPRSTSNSRALLGWDKGVHIWQEDNEISHILSSVDVRMLAHRWAG